MTASNAFRGRDWTIALGITAFALLLRILGVTFGLPWFHHWDEGWVTDNASHMLRSKDWEPRIYQYGAPLSLLMGLSLRALSWLWPDRLFDPNDSALVHWIGRTITVVISSSGAGATYIAARFATLGDRTATVRATYAALLYATAAELVSHGRYAVTDACLAALVAWALGFSALYLRGGRLVWAASAVMASALAAAFKVTAATTVAIPLLAFLARRYGTTKKASLALFLVSGPAAALVFFALNPHVLIHWPIASADISVRINQYREGRVPEFVVRHAGLDHLFGVIEVTMIHMFHRWPAASVIAASTSVAGLVCAVRERSRVTLVGLGHAALVVGGLAFGSRAFLLRNYLVACPVLCIGFGFALSSINRDVIRRTLVPVFAAVFVLVPLVQAIRTQERATDTRELAIDWIAKRAVGPAPSIVALGPDIGVDSTGDRKELRGAFERPYVVLRDVKTAADVERLHPDFVLVVSHPDYYGRGDVWPFREVRAYRQVADFEANPYEHNFDVTPTWMGRFSSIVLEHQRE